MSSLLRIFRPFKPRQHWQHLARYRSFRDRLGHLSALKGISAAGSASLETVAGPIGAALVVAGVGIAVAVPAVLVYNYFLRRLKLASADLDDFAHDFYSLAQKKRSACYCTRC